MDKKFIINQVYKKILTFDAKNEGNEYKEKIYSVVQRAVEREEVLNFISFTCSTINSEYLFSDSPWLYVNTETKGNNLEPDVERLALIVKEMRALYPNTTLTILIGNTDPYYIYLQQFKNFSAAERTILWNKFAEQWDTYRNKLEAWLVAAYPDIKAKVVSWYAFEKSTEQKTGKSFENFM